MTNSDSIELFQRVRDGDSAAEVELFDEYVVRLLALVRKRLSRQFARRIDAEDIVQSAYGSFFAGVNDDRFVLTNSGDLWRLLAAVTMNKLKSQIERNSAAKRNVQQEHSVNLRLGESVCDVPLEAMAADPTPADEAAMDEEIQTLMATFDEKQKVMFQLRLAGETIDEIAEKISCSERTVRRFFDQKVKPMLADQLGAK